MIRAVYQSDGMVVLALVPSQLNPVDLLGAMDTPTRPPVAREGSNNTVAEGDDGEESK
jgi:hypothetical protein